MRNSLARSLLTWRIHDRWLCEKPWMNRISGPAGLPHSCAEMVRPSGVFTMIGLYFKSSPKLGGAIAANKAAAAIAILTSRTVVFIEILPLFFSCGRTFSLALASVARKFGCHAGAAWREKENRGHVPTR